MCSFVISITQESSLGHLAAVQRKPLHTATPLHVADRAVAKSSQTRPNTKKPRAASGVANHRTGHEGTEGEHGYSCTLSLTSALDRGGWSTPSPGRLIPGKDPVAIVQEAGWDPGPVCTNKEKSRPHRDSISGPRSQYIFTLIWH